MDTLIAAVKSGDLSAVESCLREPACDLDYSDTDGWSALHHAVNANRPDIVLLLLQSGIDPNVREHFGGTPLHWACEVGDRPSAQHLIRHRADLDAKDHKGRVPLDDALFKGNWEIAEALSAAGANWSLVTAFVPHSREDIRAVLERTADSSRFAREALNRLREEEEEAASEGNAG